MCKAASLDTQLMELGKIYLEIGLLTVIFIHLHHVKPHQAMLI
jgi:hypothetical protein